jgi:polyribonucleotide 5'-hydroxyl-kinase
VNTCGWVEGVGYELLLHSIDVFTVDVVLVIDHERLYSDLTTDVKTKLKSQRNIEIVKLPKSGGVCVMLFSYYIALLSNLRMYFLVTDEQQVVPRDPTFRRKTRMNRIREYFYGKMNELSPHSLVFDFQDLNIYKVGGGPQAPSSALPLGAEPTIDPIRLVEQFPSLELLHSVLGVSHAQSIDKLLETNIAGFVYVTDVNMERRKLTVLSPSPGILPSRYLLLGSLKWLE